MWKPKKTVGLSRRSIASDAAESSKPKTEASEAFSNRRGMTVLSAIPAHTVGANGI